MDSNVAIILEPQFIVYFTISFLGALLGICSLVIRHERLKKGNVVFRKRDYWFCNLYLLINPIIVILCNTSTYYRPAQTSAFLAIGISFVVIVNYISKTITFDDNGITSRNSVFVKSYYPYSAIISKRVYHKKYTRRRHNHRYSRYVDFLQIQVKDEEKNEIKTISMIVDSYNYEELIRMLDIKCPQFNYVNNTPVGNYNPMNFYGNNNY